MNNNFAKISKFLTGFVVLYLFCVQRADAYIDPGTGSYVFQLLIGGIVGGLFALKLFWRRIIDYIKNIFTKTAKKDA